ncbi:MAG TPA: phosphocarrier protein HPr, partial [Erysipelotrichaceae bacterium]|nr:phosphocarrier protein HPr [Erysipelotrichaceae bacterium]
GVPTKASVEITAEGEDEKDAIASIEKVVKEQKVAE